MEFQKSELFSKLRDTFRETLAEFLAEYFERDPVTLIKEITTYAGSHFDYFRDLLSLEKKRLANNRRKKTKRLRKNSWSFSKCWTGSGTGYATATNRRRRVKGGSLNPTPLNFSKKNARKSSQGLERIGEKRYPLIFPLPPVG
ncbi:MAG: hypothetical protein Q6352_017495 [Candidatus Freyrarchaeum guaymaensis]